MEKFAHLPFEDWLLSDAALTPEENRSLQEHLLTCVSCRRLSAVWQEVENQLHVAPFIAPAAGFTARWAERLEDDRRKIHRRQTLLILVVAVGGAAFLFASLGLLVLPLLPQPDAILWSLAYRLVALVSLVRGVQDFFSTSLSTLAHVIPPAWWILSIGVLSELFVIWFVILRLLTNPRRVTL